MSKFNNRFLFSDYYLEEILPGQEEFTGPGKILSDSFGSIKRLFKDKRKELPQRPEASLEEEFIRPILDILGHLYEVQPPLPTSERVNHPDYAFFASSEEKLFAVNHLGKKEFWTRAVAVGDAKSWERSLDKKLSGGGDHFDSLNPSYQIDSYLRDSELKWGILTNGRYWRLYNRDTSYKLGVYYEIDLQKLIEKGSVDDFKYFYLFFRKEAFLPKGASFLDRTYQGSIDYAKEVGERLKENVYEALRLLCEGCLKYPENQLGTDNLEVIHDNALVFLYRLLFIFYAESLGLLPVERNHKYRELYSIRAIKLDIAGRKDKGDNFSTTETRYCDALHQLFTIINSGNKLLDVPAYNGGLFDSEKHPFLNEIKVSDYYMASVIDLLARAKERGDERPASVDYRSLAVQHLGSIYEGLLEYKVKYDSGKIILETDRGERKATGSYYTPDYIVNYIVENTIGPLCKETEERLKCQIKELEEKVKKSQGINKKTYQAHLDDLKQSYDDEVLKLKVLDPAMGSGHFLVRAAEYLAVELATSPYAHDEEAPEDETAIDYWKRKVVEHCIYGVDLNPLAVELAKLSLWLSTVSKGKPLSFLDHHLRVGNSLIGARLKDLSALPQMKKSKKPVNVQQLVLLDVSKLTQDISLLMGDFKRIEGLPSDTVDQVKEKEQILNLVESRRSRYIKQADLWTSTFFGNEMVNGIYGTLVEELRETKGNRHALSRKDAEACVEFKKAETIKAEKRFFHWELEFPEVFFDEIGRMLENPGFDVVMGNPPWEIVLGKDTKVNINELRRETDYLKFHLPALKGEVNLYKSFICIGFVLLKKSGLFGFIVPATIRADDSCSDIRSYIFSNTVLHCLAEFPESAKVFKDVTQACTIIIWTQGGTTVKIPLAIGLQNEKELCNIEFVPVNVELCKAIDSKKMLIPSVCNKQECLLFEKLCNQPRLVEIFGKAVFEGEVHLTVYKDALSSNSKDVPLIRGDHVRRYLIDRNSIKGTLAWLNAIQFHKLSGVEGKAAHFKNTRIAYQQVANMQLARRLRSTIIPKDNYLGNTLGYILLPEDSNFNLYALQAIFTSKLLNWRFKLCSTNNHILVNDVESLPIRRIAFVTPEGERKRLLEKAKELFNAGNIEPTLSSVTEHLQKKHVPDPERVKKHNTDPLNKEYQVPEGALWEQSDIVHDFLSFLAEQMIELNKEKQAEIKGFLTWLEREIGVEVDDLTGKSYLKNYIGDYQKNEAHLSLDTFLEILKKNKNKLSVNISSRTFIENLETEYNASLNKLLPIKEKLKQTDWLIDQIVYKLYGLTDEEIGIVEGSA